MTQIGSYYRSKDLKYHIIGGISAIAMVFLSIYLTNHYFEVKYPTGVSGGGLCDINAFFNCDVATNSPLSNIMGVPISLIGLLLGLFVLFGYIHNNQKLEGTLYKLLTINAVGCAALFIYSLVGLGGLCPACTLYYVASFTMLFSFYKTTSIAGFDFLSGGIFAIVYVAIFAFTYNYVSEKNDSNSQYAKSLIKQYENLPDMGEPRFQSDYMMATTPKGFSGSPIRIVKFSDFQCPACRGLSTTLHKIIKKYQGKISVQYFFYPLDHNCNPAMKNPLHENACHAAYLASCLPQKFKEIEDVIFSNQQILSHDWINKKAKEYGVTECINSEETKKTVSRYIEVAKDFNVRSTPTFLLNGVKIEGALSVDNLSILIDHILSKK